MHSSIISLRTSNNPQLILTKQTTMPANGTARNIYRFLLGYIVDANTTIQLKVFLLEESCSDCVAVGMIVIFCTCMQANSSVVSYKKAVNKDVYRNCSTTLYLEAIP